MNKYDEKQNEKGSQRQQHCIVWIAYIYNNHTDSC